MTTSIASLGASGGKAGFPRAFSPAAAMTLGWVAYGVFYGTMAGAIVAPALTLFRLLGAYW